MSAYRDAIAGETQRSEPIVIVAKEKASDNFWTAIKWLGAAVTIVVAYREAKDFYQSRLRGQDEETATEEAAE